MAQPRYVSETQIVKKLARDPKTTYRWGRHAPVEMAAREPVPATESDVKHCLMNCQVVLEEYKQDIVWRVRGRDLDGRTLEVVLVANEEEGFFKIVTVI